MTSARACDRKLAALAFRRHVQRRLAAAGAALLLAGCASAPRFDGPIAARNQHPAQLTVGRLRPRTAAPEPEDGVQLDWRNGYSSLFLFGQANGDAFEMDGEYLRTSLAARLGLGAGVDVEAEVAFAHTSGGFLDDFVVDWHSFWGFPDQGRDTAPRDDYEVRAVENGRTTFAVDRHGLNLLDLPLILSWAPVRIGPDRDHGVMLRAGVDLPTGDDRAGFGSGEADWMLGIVGEVRTGPFAWNAHAEHTWAGNPARARSAAFEFEDVLSLGAGVEIAFDEHWTGLVQVEMDQSTLRRLDLARASDVQWLLWTALRVRLTDHVRLEAGIGEDLSQYVAPDFTAWLALSIDFGAQRPH